MHFTEENLLFSRKCFSNDRGESILGRLFVFFGQDPLGSMLSPRFARHCPFATLLFTELMFVDMFFIRWQVECRTISQAR